MPAELTPNQLKWVEALESGDYEQGRGALHNVRHNLWCCLGVACDVAIRNGLPVSRDSDLGGHSDLESFDGSTLFMPPAVAEWLVSRRTDPDPDIGGIEATVLNDEEGLTFEEIAASIREYGVK